MRRKFQKTLYFLKEMCYDIGVKIVPVRNFAISAGTKKIQEEYSNGY